MKATLNIYKDCTSEEPTKQYTCFRLLLGVSKKIGELQQKMQKTNDEAEQEKYTLQILKAIFPNFEDEDFNYIDPVQYLEFVNDITLESNRIVATAQKN